MISSEAAHLLSTNDKTVEAQFVGVDAQRGGSRKEYHADARTHNEDDGKTENISPER